MTDPPSERDPPHSLSGRASPGGPPSSIESVLSQLRANSDPTETLPLCASLAKLVLDDLAQRWQPSKSSATDTDVLPREPSPPSTLALPAYPKLEDYLAAIPELGPADDAPVAWVASEYRARIRAGDRPSHEEYLRRFPRLGDPLRAELARIDQEPGTNPDLAATNAWVDGEADSQIPSGWIGRYRVTGRLGAGAFGVIYQAHDPDLDRLVAIKVPRRDRFASDRDQEQFLTEARTVARLKHPGLLPVYDVGRLDDGTCFVVMESVAGGSLLGRIEAGKIPHEQCADLMARIALALDQAHLQGFVHRDIKPANILLDEQGLPLVTDFGLAAHETTLDQRAGEVAGTPAYMAPEQIRGLAHRLDGRTDVWSLGVVLYEMLVRRRPFAAPNNEDLTQQIQYDEPRPPREIDPLVPEELERICLKCLSKRMTDRYASARHLAEDLRAWKNTLSGARRAAGDDPSVPDDPGPLASGSSTYSSIHGTTSIVPKGLRSFDADDQRFFPLLLPGHVDRDGLPDGIRFWKTHLEQVDRDETFPVGMMYGPSGSGKSSLIKAGILPRLASHVVPVYLEATPHDTETRLLYLLRKSCPWLAVDLNLVQTLQSLRSGTHRISARKVLIVLDQFEQWLHSHHDPHDAELIQSLRHCDGARVQCLVMVRDDFWMAASQFMEELEIPLVQGHNCGAVHLFDTRHARHVLELFGRALGCLPATGEIRPAQKDFLDQSVAGLAVDDKVVSIRLALFAEMVKGKSWTPSTLSRMGGIAGVGVTFLEESFSSSAAAPKHRYHQAAARAVLRALLPDAGSDIRGHQVTREQLQTTSGYERRPQDFAELLRILDAELRLITPSEGEEGAEEGESGIGSRGSETVQDASTPRSAPTTPDSRFPTPRYFQLTHDYLVPSLREWLFRKQRETRRGRAEILLADREALWSSRPTSRHLPSAWETIMLAWHTRASRRTVPEQSLLRAAKRHHLLRGVLAAAILVALCAVGWQVRARVLENQARNTSAGLVDRLLDARLEEAPAISAELAPYRRWVDGPLHDVLADAKAPQPRKVRAALGLLASDHSQAKQLFQNLLAAEPNEALVLIGVLTNHRDTLRAQLWRLLDDDQAASTPRLRAALALAAYEPPASPPVAEHWHRSASFLADELLAEVRRSPSQYEPLVAGLQPAGTVFIRPLGLVLRDPGRNVTDRELATNILVRYARDDAGVMVDLALDAEVDQFPLVFRALERHPGESARLLAEQLQVRARPDWHDAPLDPEWREPSAELAAQVARAAGLIAERFAFCQTLPLAEFDALSQALQAHGYRPTRLRPYLQQGQLLSSVLWRRDGRPARWALGLASDELLQRDAELQSRGLLPLDVAGYATPREDQARASYAAIWEERSSPSDAGRVFVDLASVEVADGQELHRQGMTCTTLQQFTLSGVGDRFAQVWRRQSAVSSAIGNASEQNYSANVSTDRLQLDVSLGIRSLLPPPRLAPTWRLAIVQQALLLNADDLDRRFERARLQLELGQSRAALDDLVYLAAQEPDWPEVYQVRSLAHARLGDAEAARADQARFALLVNSASSAAYLDAVLSAVLGESEAGISRLEASILEHEHEPDFLYNAACACALVGQRITADAPDRAATLQARAVELLRQALDNSYDDFEQLLADPDLDSLRELEGYQRLLAAARHEPRLGAVFQANPQFTSIELHGLSPTEHLARARQLLKQGYRPQAISSFAVAPASELDARAAATMLTSSVWHLPVIPSDQQDRLALRAANGAVALGRLGKWEQVWPLLPYTPEPRVRGWLMRQLPRLGAEPKILAARLLDSPPSEPRNVQPRLNPSTTTEFLFDPETSLRRALILTLGNYDEARLPRAVRERWLQRLEELYLIDPDPGIHSAVAWLLRRWGRQEQLVQLDEALRSDQQPKADAESPLARPPAARRWYVNGQGQTMVSLAGPLEFLMGSRASEPDHDQDEVLHRRRIRRSFAIGAHEVTVAQMLRWREDFQFGAQFARSADCPVNAVTWYEAAEYCNWLSQQEGIDSSEWCYETNAEGKYGRGMKPRENFLACRGYRLPTEAEWEYACRAGAATSRYYGSDEALLGEYAWYSGNSHHEFLLPVGTLKPNDLGLFDTHGNVAEWCSDIALDNPHSRLDVPFDDVLDTRPVIDAEFRVLRGATFFYLAPLLRSAHRDHYQPDGANTTVGFRVARTLVADPP